MECAATASPRSPNNGSSDKHHPSAIVSTTQIKLTIHRNRQGDNVGVVPSTLPVRVPTLPASIRQTVPVLRGEQTAGRRLRKVGFESWRADQVQTSGPLCLCTLRMIRLGNEASRHGRGSQVVGQCLTNVRGCHVPSIGKRSRTGHCSLQGDQLNLGERRACLVVRENGTYSKATGGKNFLLYRGNWNIQQGNR